MRMAGLSDTGRVRARNEDALDWDEEAGVAMVADGMGGHPAGDVASRIAVSHIMTTVRRDAGRSRWLDTGGRVDAALQGANTAIMDDAARHPERREMGTTAVLAAFGEHQCRIAHVGDSRAYHFQADGLRQLTRDHTVAQQALDRQLITAEQARHTPERHQLTRALGLDDPVSVDVLDVPSAPGELFLLCSDGLSEMLDDDAISQALTENSRDPQRAARLLVRLALEHGGHDNVSVIVILA
jgi:protein phosphatase